MSRRALALVWLAACAREPGHHEPRAGVPAGSPTGTTPAGTPTTTTTPTGLVVHATPRACADPTARDTAAFDRRELPPLPISGHALHGGGVTITDLDGDGWEDLVLTSEAGLELWLGTGDRALPFRQPDTDWFAGLDLSFAVGTVAADLDLDGRLDLVLSRWQAPNALLRNTGTRFVAVTPYPMLAHAWRTQAATAADLDGDGDLDLFFGSYGPRPDTSFDPDMVAADPAELYRNDGGGAWADLSATLSQEIHDGYTFQATFLDTDGDALPEGFLANDFGVVRPSLRLVNHGDLGFEPDPTWHPESEDMGVGVGDVDGDQLPDFLLTSAAIIAVLKSDTGVADTWVDASDAWRLHVNRFDKNQWFGWACDWLDVDNDTDLDAIALFGTWDDWFTPPAQQDALWLQVERDPPLFEEHAGDPFWSVADAGVARGLAIADLDHDGWLDLVRRQLDGPTLIDLSRCGAAGAVQVALSQPGSNPNAIGARVVLETASQLQTRWLLAGGSGLYGGGPPIAHFGVDAATSVDRLEITWPDGAVDVVEAPPVGAYLRIERRP